jgi:sugar phosphate isomerase/epimerase
MRNPLALHTWTLDTTPLGRVLEIVRETGWQAVELRRLDFARAAERGQAAEAVLDLVRSSGVATACVGVALGWIWAEGDERRKLLDAFDESCRWAKALGCRTVMSPVDRGRGDAARAAASVTEVGDTAARHGVRLALEFNSQCEQINTLASIREILAKAAHPHVGLLLDAYHLGRSGARPGDLKDVAGAEIAYVQFSDVPRSGLVAGQALDRLPPGQGSVPFKEFFAAIERAGYAGYCSYEAPNPGAWARDPTAVAREAIEATKAAAA